MTNKRMPPWWIALVIVLGAFACSKSEPMKSNFASVRIANDRILAANTGEPYSGKLIAKDQDITAVARAILDDNTFEHVTGTDLTGLVLVLPVDQGIPSGRAVVHVDLHATKLNPEVARRSEAALAVARARGRTIKLAEATFKAGKLDGAATVFAPAPKGAVTKVAEVQFRDHVLHGAAIEYFPGTTQARRALHFEGGVQTGPQRSFHANGTLEREATYVAGVPHGEVKESFANGAKRAHAAFDHGKPIGTHEAWYPNGQLRREVVYEADGTSRATRWFSNGGSADAPPDGVIEEFHSNGNVETRTTYANGEKHGAFEAFYADGGNWKRGHYDRGQPQGVHLAWWKNGKPALESTYAAGVLVGDYKRWYANGKPWESAHYEAGALAGPYRKWWKNGKLAHEYQYKDGKLDGDYKQLYDTGKKWVLARYDRGKPQGAIERWFPDGKLGYVMNHTDGRPDGPYKRWYADGTRRLEATYVKGHLHGDFKNWREDGTVYELATYERGVKVQTSRRPTADRESPTPE